MHDVMQESKAGETFFQQMAGDQPLAITAFKGYVKHFDNARQGVLNKGSTGIRWAEQLLQGIKDDDPEMCSVAMSHEGTDFDIKVRRHRENPTLEKSPRSLTHPINTPRWRVEVMAPPSGSRAPASSQTTKWSRT